MFLKAPSVTKEEKKTCPPEPGLQTDLHKVMINVRTKERMMIRARREYVQEISYWLLRMDFFLTQLR